MGKCKSSGSRVAPSPPIAIAMCARTHAAEFSNEETSTPSFTDNVHLFAISHVERPLSRGGEPYSGVGKVLHFFSGARSSHFTHTRNHNFSKSNTELLLSSHFFSGKLHPSREIFVEEQPHLSRLSRHRDFSEDPPYVNSPSSQ